MKKSTKRVIAATVIVGGTAAACYYIYKHPECCECLTKKNDEDDSKRIIRISDEETDDEDSHRKVAQIEKDIQDGLEGNGDYPSEVKEISLLYPYLSEDFIYDSYQQNMEFAQDYENGSIVQIVHVAKFADDKQKDAFIRIIEEHNYQVEETEAGIVRASGFFEVEDTKILSEIYNVANQVACLDGDYLSYQVEEA